MYCYTTVPVPRNNNIEFPKDREFYFLDIMDNLKYFQKANPNYPDSIYVYSEDQSKIIRQNVFFKSHFWNYDFIKVKVYNSNVYINFIIPKERLNNANKESILLAEIKNKPSYVNEILRAKNINFNTKENIILQETPPQTNEDRFYNRIFIIYINQSFPRNPGNYNNMTYNKNNNSYGKNNHIYNNNTFNNAGHNVIANNSNVNSTPSKNNKYLRNIDNNIDYDNYNQNYKNQNASSLNQSYLPNANTNPINNNSPQINNNINNYLNNNNNKDNQKSQNDNNQINPPVPNPNYKYIFPKKGLKNIGSTYYMNATLQCLLHVCELIVYFLEEYPKDKNTLNDTNKNVKSRGDISEAFYKLVKGVCDTETYSSYNSYNSAFSPDEFKRALGLHNSQFRQFEANYSKDLILYLLQTMHDELNYFGNKNKKMNFYPNQYDMVMAYNYFTTVYNSNNFSKISVLFYGTYKNSTICRICKNILYNFQKFEFISFAMYNYNKKKFDLYDGFRDNSKISLLTGDNKFFCGKCNKLQDAETTCKIFEPPNKLLINIDYGKNKMYKPSSVNFDEVIDITEFVDFDYKLRIKYRIIGVCTDYGYSGQTGHYIAFCKNTRENKWYEFNDSSCRECGKNSIYGGSPYLLLYERTFD